MAGIEMAGAAVGLVVEYLADIIRDEAQLLGGVRHEVAQLEKTLRSIRAFLKDVERMQDSGEVVKEWVRQVRDVAYDIENVVDDFLLRLGPQKPHDQPRPVCCSHSFACSPRQLKARHQLGTEIKRIKSLLLVIDERKKMFSTPPLINGATSSNASLDNRRLIQPLFVEDVDIVGIEKPKREVMKKLLKEDSGLAVISVVGMGGLGKTTLVRKVYENEIVRRKFDCSAWVTVSQTYSLVVLLKAMLNSFMDRREGKFKGMEEQHSLNQNEDIRQLVQDLRDYVKTKKYLVVLDDVWTTSAWEDLRCVFPQNELKSKIVVTTRKHDVALYCSMYKENVYEMKSLLEKDACALFYKKAFGGTHPPELEKKSMDTILRVCNGLPLAIVTIGGLLRMKTPSEWNRVLADLSTIPEKHETTNFMNQVLWLSYNDLPPYLKYCLLYFGLFPEDYVVNSFTLIEQFVAEGFVKPLNEQTAQELGKSYLQELVQRSLVEVVNYYAHGQIWHCKVHDLVHRLILQQSREENFFTLATDDIKENEEVRRLSVWSDDIVPTGRNFSRLRTMHMLDARVIPKFSSFRMLRVLTLRGDQIQVFPIEIVKLYHLTYLDMSETRIEMIPKSIGNLHKLKTLNLEETNVTELPAEILHLRTIRALAVSPKNVWDGVKMPTRVGTLKCLYDLEYIRMDGGSEQAIELGKLTELRTLFMVAVQRQDWDAISDSITKMRHLENLLIATQDGEKGPFDIGFVSTLSPALQRLWFNGPLNGLKHLHMKSGAFSSLVDLRLFFSGLREDPLNALQHLPMLQQLRLYEDSFHGEEMSCGEDGFPRLIKLEIRGLDELRSVHIAKGAMPELAEMVIDECCKLEGVPFGVENLTALRKLTFYDMPREFIEKVRDKQCTEYAKVKHIPLVRDAIKDGEEWNSWKFEYLTDECQ